MKILTYILLAIFLLVPAAFCKERQIAITFDELPVVQSFTEADAREVNMRILDALKRHEVKAAGFVVGANMQNYFDVIGEWLNNGHLIGSMTNINQDINMLSPDLFISEIKSGAKAVEPMLEGFGQKARLFRYPFLHYGSTPATKQKVKNYLVDAGIRIAHCSVAPDDYVYNLSLEKMGSHPDSSKLNQLMNEYVNYVLDEIERIDRAAVRLMGGPVKHILRLRASRLNAFFLDDLLSALESEGFTYISLTSALNDPLYGMSESYYDTRGVGYVEMIAKSRKN